MPINIDRNKYQNLSHLEFLARQVVEGFITGMHKSPFHGFSVEFAEHRPYNTGEHTRHIDWKLYARTDKLYVKRYEEETNLRCRILLDVSSSMRYPEPSGDDRHSKLTFSVYAAAAIIELMRRQRDAVGITTFADKIELHSPAKSTRAHHKFLFTEMESLLAEKPEMVQTSAVQALHEVAERVHRRSLIVIFSDMFDNSRRSDELFSALQHLKFNKHEIILFHVTDRRTELDFDFENRPYTFVDTETGERIKAHPMEIRDTYLKEMNAFMEELRMRCGRYGIDFVTADINEGFNDVLMRYLIKRDKLY
ncbi:MAG TPA: DUF58 domain-containing protein [Cryomorphaceae bacterium]|nr:DUF58 domain-containing protein [Cryomorphaceae bacterium]